MIVLICGGRHYKDRYKMHADIELWEKTQESRITAVIHGNAPGADQLAGEWARERGLPEIVFPANWNYFRKSAGPIRNTWMVKFIRPDFVLAYPGGEGTRHMLEHAQKKLIPTFVRTP